MQKHTPILAVFLAACGTTHFEIGPTDIYLWDGAEPWPDFPDVLWHLQHDYPELPPALFEVSMHFFPPGRPLDSELDRPVSCQYRAFYGDIHIRPTRGSSAAGCLAHELAHHWVQVSDLDLGCVEKDSHACQGFIDAEMRLQEKVCRHSWAYDEDC